MSIEDGSRCVEGSVELYIELYIEDVEARTQPTTSDLPRASLFESESYFLLGPVGTLS